MAWTDITRTEPKRICERYPSDLNDREWAVVVPFVPPPHRGGRPRTSDMREVFNAILYIAEGGIAWRMLPRQFPPLSTVQRYFYAWRNDGTLALINYALVQAGRKLEGILLPFTLARTEPGGEYLAVHPRKPALQPRVQGL